MSKHPTYEQCQTQIEKLMKERDKLSAKIAAKSAEPTVDPDEVQHAALVDEINALRHAQAHPKPHTADQAVELMAPEKIEKGAAGHPDKVIVEVPEGKGTHLPEAQTVAAVAQKNLIVDDRKDDVEKMNKAKMSPEADVDVSLAPGNKPASQVKAEDGHTHAIPGKVNPDTMGGKK